MSRTFDVNRGPLDRPRPLLRAWAVASILLSGFGCALIAEPPTETLAKAELGLRSATEAKAGDFAPLDLQSAREKIDQSKRAMASERYEDARRLAERAQVEAELAEARAEAEIMRHAVEELRKSAAFRTEARDSRK
jgi:Domain of unknown function (DUF4398)